MKPTITVSIKELIKSKIETNDRMRIALKKALEFNDDCTQYFVLHNKSTKYNVKVGLVQGLDEDGVDEGYNEKTGLVVIGTDLPPGESARVDVSAMKCRSTRAELSLIWNNRETGDEGDLHLPDQNASPGKWLTFAEWIMAD